MFVASGLGNTLLKFELMEKAQQVFDELPEKDGRCFLISLRVQPNSIIKFFDSKALPSALRCCFLFLLVISKHSFGDLFLNVRSQE